MLKKTPFMITACVAAAMCLSACGPKPEETATPGANALSNSVASSDMTPAAAEAVSNGNPSKEANGDNLGVNTSPGQDIFVEPVGTVTAAPKKSVEAKVSQSAAAPVPVVEKTTVSALRPASFGRCAVCHSDKQGQKSGFGPNLFGIAGAKAGTVPDYESSTAMTASGVQWSRENLDAFLLSPQSKIPGNKMSFAGVNDGARRKEIVDYIIGLK